MVVAVKSRIDREHLPAVARDMTQAFQQVVNFNVAGAGNGADTTEDVLATYSLPANTLKAAGGRYLRIRAWFKCAANADNKTMRLYFGSEVIATPTAATNGKNAFLELNVFRTGASAQVVTGMGVVDTTPVTPLSITGTETDTAAIVIKATGQAGTGNANDIVCSAFTVELIGAAGA